MTNPSWATLRVRRATRDVMDKLLERLDENHAPAKARQSEPGLAWTYDSLISYLIDHYEAHQGRKRKSAQKKRAEKSEGEAPFDGAVTTGGPV